MLRPSNGKNQGTFVGDVPCWGSKEIDPRVLQRFTDVDKDHFFCLVLLIELRGKWRGPPPLPSFPREIKPYYWSPWFLYDPVIRPYFLGVCVIRGRRPLDSHDIRFFLGGCPGLIYWSLLEKNTRLTCPISSAFQRHGKLFCLEWWMQSVHGKVFRIPWRILRFLYIYIHTRFTWTLFVWQIEQRLTRLETSGGSPRRWWKKFERWNCWRLSWVITWDPFW